MLTLLRVGSLLMEKLKYIIEDSTIAALLGEQNYTNKESAVLELVKNAYDAGATELKILFENNSIVFQDNGCGMSEFDIKNKWMHVGKSDKQYQINDNDNKLRIVSGSKGIGRFALARLGEKVILYSLQLNKQAVKWETDWNYSILEEYNYLKLPGTKIIISGLRDKWTKTAICGLVSYLSKTYNDDKMSIVILADNVTYPVKRFFEKQTLGVNCKAIINFNFDANKQILFTHVVSDEFEKAAQLYVTKFDINNYDSILNICDEFQSEKWDLTDIEMKEHLTDLGSFTGSLYFNVASTRAEQEKFMYKYCTIPNPINSGIILYRNAFSISAYEGKKDWLFLGKRARKSPAAATHQTGSWRVRENQLSGKIEIDKARNKMLRDLSNRQGLDENKYYELFVEIIQNSIKEFERYRQSIILAINKKNKVIDQETDKSISDSIAKSFKNALNMSVENAKKLSTEVRDYKNETKDLLRGIKDIESRYKYDVGILNVLATIGLKASSQAHEMKNDRNFVATVNENIIEALKRYNVWDFLCAPEQTEKSYRNVPHLLEKSGDIDKKLLGFMDTMLQEIEKEQFKVKWQNLNEILEKEKQIWEKDYAWLSIKFTLERDIVFFCSEDVLRVIIDNLILNSVQQNYEKNRLEISITVNLMDKGLIIRYSDNGRGLAQKYHSNPHKILEVHETTRKNGHGLGMWIVHNTIVALGGEVLNIGVGTGFTFEFAIKGEVQ